ncbi:hypothetical protein [Haloactinomyces albus]|uniref:Uncharacterized protein n=1 Tax=Haloactinomyces albus TaxID=1352928 RepID=A0AAE3Z826_9ACTN|nr:hypothetical protein [Haloactinomyces albus]MDR7300077.1 hypothetical protein [Haloactinomyces albus]
MEMMIFLAGIAVLTGLGMVLAWPRQEDLGPDEPRESGEHRSVRASRSRGKA